ncbi:hypothetical protein MmTuc01_2899 [Methanosarcina mazei Tuc01]|uniref:Uncharacterized protein n=1 Tax=Methanosarcina mazei Tuc01 TaxID=1236903 RepID=M1QMA5_METMZ|nr:hypothetical protein MmTuc01_2899 [Methanosarcina mazei Tuc01]
MSPLKKNISSGKCRHITQVNYSSEPDKELNTIRTCNA